MRGLPTAIGRVGSRTCIVPVQDTQRCTGYPAVILWRLNLPRHQNSCTTHSLQTVFVYTQIRLRVNNERLALL